MPLWGCYKIHPAALAEVLPFHGSRHKASSLPTVQAAWLRTGQHIYKHLFSALQLQQLLQCQDDKGDKIPFQTLDIFLRAFSIPSLLLW